MKIIYCPPNKKLQPSSLYSNSMAAYNIFLFEVKMTFLDIHLHEKQFMF